MFIEIDLSKAMKDKMKFFKSKNGVILSPGLEGAISRVNINQIQKYFHKVFIEDNVVYEMEKPITKLLVINTNIKEIENGKEDEKNAIVII